MGMLEKMNEVIEYIENNLENEIDMNKIASISCYSQTTFQRMFSIICDLPLSEYIRRRRLTQAAFDLQNNDIKIIDIALKYGYSSPETFTRAFSALHGVSPTASKNAGVSLQAYPRISFQLALKGDAPINYRIEFKEAFTVYGIERIISMANGENWNAAPAFWNEIALNGELDKLVQSANQPFEGNGLNPLNVINSHYYTGNETIPYMIFAMKTEKSNTEGYKTVNVPSSMWAVFKSDIHTFEGTSKAIANLTKRVFSEWLPAAKYTKLEMFELELTYKLENMYYSEIWIRVKPEKA